ncbi:MAG: ribonuclease P protein component 1 [Candidatus Aenigmatarchaeota archaeon]
MRNQKNILRHELIGLECEIVKAKNKYQVGLKGKIIDETMKTILLENEKIKRIPKQGTTFRLKLDNCIVDVDGDKLISRPEDRIKKKFKKW